MTNTKHSPAPWKVHEDLPCRIIKESHGRLRDYVEIGRAICEDVGVQTAMANARVMALSPEMLAILKKILKGKDLQLDGVTGDAICKGKKRIRDIIKRAKGETT